jgi:NodT family efflux transporter outer membrane factor (OMF) lipoprotein
MTARDRRSPGCLRGATVTAFFVAAVFGAGCAVGPDYRAPTPATAEPFAAVADVSAEPPIGEWWHEFQDPDLNGLVEVALRDNPDLANAEALVRRARAAAVVAGASHLPTMNAGVRVSEDKLSRNGENLALIPVTPRTTEFTDYRVGLDASWEIDLAGRSRRDLEAAVARFGSAQETRNDARVVVASEVALSYIDFRVAERRLAIAQDRFAAATECRRLLELARTAGVVGDDEVHRAEADVANAMSAAAPLQASVASSLVGLTALTGLRTDEIRVRVAGQSTVPLAPAAVPVGLSSDVLKRRPDVRRAERDLAASTAEVGSAVAAQFPRLSLMADGGLDSVRFGDLGAAASRYWNIAPQLSLPLFSGGRLRGQVKQAEAARDGALAVYRGRVLRALADAESSVLRYSAARSRGAAAESAAVALEASIATVERREGAGESSRIDVLVARRTADDARDQQVAAAGEVARTYVALNRSLGGGWQVP